MDAPVTEAIEVLRRTPELLVELLRPLPVAWVDVPGEGDAWSPRDVVAHLLTTEAPFVERVTRMTELDDPALPAIDERALLEGFRPRPLYALLEELGRSRADHAETMLALPPGAWSRTARHEEVGPLTMAELVCHKAHHDLEHLAQLAELLRAPFDAARGPMRAY